MVVMIGKPNQGAIADLRLYFENGRGEMIGRKQLVEHCQNRLSLDGGVTRRVVAMLSITYEDFT